MLEPRRLLSTITWNTTAAPNGGDWDTPGDWVGGNVPGPSDTAVIKGLTGPGIVTLDSGGTDAINSLTTDASVVFELISGTLSLAVGSSSSFGGPSTIFPGASMTVGAGAVVAIAANQTFADNGTLTLSDGDNVTLDGFCCSSTEQITVGGTMVATNTTFTNNGSGNNYFSIGPGGRLEATGSSFSDNSLSFDNSSILNSGDLTGNSFNLPISVPYGDIQYLANNTSFQQININAATLASGTLNLNLIGTNTANLSYAFPGGFNVGTGAAIAVGPHVPVYIQAQQTFADNGTVTFATGDLVTLNGFCCTSTEQITVGGTMLATNTTFSNNGSGNNYFSVGPGGRLEATGSSFSDNSLSFDNSSILNSGDLTGDSFNLPISVPYGDIQYLGNNTSFQIVSINAATLASGTLNLNLIGTNTANLSYAFPGGFTVGTGAAIAVGPHVPVYIQAQQTFADNGTVTFATGDLVTLNGYCCTSTEQITVGGTMVATNTTFTNNGSGNNYLSVGPGGRLEATGSSFNDNSLSFDNSSILNSGDLTGDSFNLPISVPYGDIQYLGNNTSFQIVNINAATLASGTLNLNLIGTNTANLSYAFPGGFTVGTGAAIAVGPHVPVYIQAQQTFADNGTVTFATGDLVTLNGFCCSSTEQITVGGTMVATNTTFTNNGSGNNYFSIGPGGRLEATGSSFSDNSLSFDNSSILNSGDLTGNSFNLPISVPYGDIQYLGNNTSFQIININAVTLASGTLNLNLIGTNTANLSYAFPGGFNVGTGAAIAVGPHVPVYIQAQQTFADDGTVTFATGDTVTLNGYCCSSTEQITVGGAMVATNPTFTTNGSGNNYLSVGSGGRLNVTNGAIYLNQLTVASGSAAVLTGDVLPTPMTIDSNSNTGGMNNPSITGDDFSNLPANGITASGDPNATIYLSGNYWGTTNPVGIAAKIVDHNDNANLPTIAFSPFVADGASGTVAAPVTATFSPTDKSINLSATVSTTAGVPINEGTETFTILNGTQVIGNTTTAVNVSNGNVATQYTLPKNTASGQYIIEASYSGTLNYLPATDTLHFLTVSPAGTTTTIAKSISTTFSGVSDQTLALSAQVSSTAGAINEGIVTFTNVNGGNLIGSSVNANIAAGAAGVNYTLPKGTAGGAYTVRAVYTDPDDFATSTGTSQLTVNAAATTVAPAGSAAAFDEISSEGISLSANVSSLAGTIDEGSVTFSVLNGSGTQIAGPFVMSVSNGVAGGNAFLPAGTPVGSDVIQAVYNGTASFAASLPASSGLAVSAAATTTAAAATSTPFSSASQTVALDATVTSTAGAVKEGTVTFTILNGPNPVGTPVPVTVSSGNASASYILPAATAIGAYTIQAVYTDTGSFLGSSDLTHYLTDTQPAAAKLVLSTPPSSTATAGTAFVTQPVIDEEDQFGNLETGDNSTVVTVSLASGAGPLIGTFTATVSGGVATFTNLDDDTAETISLKFSSGNLATATSGNIVVSPAAASKLVMTQQPSSSATAGVPFTTQPVVKEEDQDGNVITTDSTHTVTAARGTVGTAALQGSSLTVTLSSGVATFGGLSYDKAETMNIGFTTNASRGERDSVRQYRRQPRHHESVGHQPATVHTSDGWPTVRDSARDL